VKPCAGKATLLPSLPSIRPVRRVSPSDELFVRPQEQPVDSTRPFVRDAFLPETSGNSALRKHGTRNRYTPYYH